MNTCKFELFRIHKINLLIAVMLLISGCSRKANSPNQHSSVPIEELEKNFEQPPEEVKPWVYWYWINNHVSKEGITKDLQNMADLGIGAALIGNIYLNDLPPGVPDGNVPMLSEEWKQLTQHAIREAGRLGIDIGLFNSPGWSQSGGPWNDVSNSMRYLASTEIKVEGGRRIQKKLPDPTEDFEDVTLLAFPSTAGGAYDDFTVSADQDVRDLPNILDQNLNTSIDLGNFERVSMTFKAEENKTVRSVTITPSQSTFISDVKVSALVQGEWKEIRSFQLDKRSAMDQLSFQDHPPVVISFPEIRSSEFKVEFSRISPNPSTEKVGLAEITFSSKPYLEFFVEKQLAKLHQTPLPLDDAYKWPFQPEPIEENLTVETREIIDLSDKLSADGVLTWDAPEGEWTILRTGMATTGISNAPAAPNATGLEVDKINRKALKQHFEGFIGDILSSMPPEERTALKYVVADSYETGSQNWTEGFADEFMENYGYDPMPFLPVMTGRIVNSVDESNRFLWDLRRLIADQVAYEYVGGLRELCEENGLELWLENYGHWGFPSEFLKYGGQAHMIGGEFWAEGDLGSIECKAASSAAHIYGKNQVSAESYTAAGDPFMRYPARLKRRGDWSFSEGINHVVLHVYIQQPYDSVPGVNAWFGTEFNRHNTWFNEAESWIDYQRRNQYMLQQGRYVADVAYFIGEDAPKMTGVTDPPLPEGYSFDYINAEVLMDRVTVKDGRITLPDGLSYSILVLPDSETMRPELLQKLEELISEGAVIMGNAPLRSPSLENFPEADNQLLETVKELWGENYQEVTKVVQHGKGKIFPRMDLGLALDQLGSNPDFKTAEKKPIVWTHRKLENQHIYFLSNQSEEKISFDASFRVKGLRPELWEATTGSIRVLPEYTEGEIYTQVPLQLNPSESVFIVFTERTVDAEGTRYSNFETPETLAVIDTPWEVQFTNEKLGIRHNATMNQLKDWVKHEDREIRHFSGTATYRTTFNFTRHSEEGRLFLDIGEAHVVANVRLNGKRVGGLWTSPWRLEVTEFLKKGKNELEIEVTNLWTNTLIAESKKKKEDRKTWTLVGGDYSDYSLQPSGLKGPVKIVSLNGIFPGDNGSQKRP